MRTTRIAFAKHRQGHIFPVIINTNTLDSSFVGIIQPLPCQDDFIFFYEHSLMMCAATQGALSMTGVSSIRLCFHHPTPLVRSATPYQWTRFCVAVVGAVGIQGILCMLFL